MEISETALKFIDEHAKDDTNALRLKYDGKSTKMDFPIEFALLQIEARRKAQRKIPSFLENVLFVFPDILAAEQASNEAVARFHASLIRPDSTLLDLTAGLGIDDMTFAIKGINVTACEINHTKADVLKHNSETLGFVDRIRVINTDSLAYAASCDKRFDTVFADPARRSSSGKRLHALSDCQPDILASMGIVMRLSDRILIKSSPLLDLTLIRETVRDLHHIYVVCMKGECKEVLIEIIKDAEFTGTSVVDLDMHGTVSEFLCHHTPIVATSPLADRREPIDYTYLYEPNAGVMKTGAWGDLSRRFTDICKADSNTHLFLSDTLYRDFPGRILKMDAMPDRKALKGLKGGKYNVVSRNYPQSALEVAKKHSLMPSEDRYLYAFRYKGKPICVTAYQVESHDRD